MPHCEVLENGWIIGDAHELDEVLELHTMIIIACLIKNTAQGISRSNRNLVVVTICLET